MPQPTRRDFLLGSGAVLLHAATAHGILRHNGVEIGKRDFLGVS